MAYASLDLKTDRKLLDRLNQAAAHRPSHREVLEQRISFVIGSVKDSSGVTRERIREVLLEQDGEGFGTKK